MSSVALLAAVLSVGAVSIEGTWVITEDHSYSSWCGEQPGYPTVGSTVFARVALIDVLPDGARYPSGPGYFQISSGYEYHGFGELESDHILAMTGFRDFVGRPTGGQLMLPGEDHPVNNPGYQPCLYTVEETAWDEWLIGDSNYDGVFDSGDLIAVFRAGQYEDGTSHNSMWDTGDWNADLDFTSGDLVVALQTGAYSAASASPVPEPTSLLFVALMFAYVLRYLLTT